MAMHDNLFALRQLFAEQGLHPSDVLVEFRDATLVAGTVEVPTVFKNGNILFAVAFKKSSAVVNEQEAFTSDLIVTAGAITVSGPTGSTAGICVMIVGRTDL